jgi:hypothetical protein
MNDLDKIENFCSKLKSNSTNNKIKKDDCDNNSFAYLNSLKSLKGISKETKSTLLKAIKEYQSISDPNDAAYVEAELIRRFLRPNSFLSTSIKMVTGPVSFYQMSHPTLLHIFYLFGDFHQRAGGCKNDLNYHIKDWIDLTISHSPVFIDVYLEKPYTYKNYITSNEKEATAFLKKYINSEEFKKTKKTKKNGGCYLIDTMDQFQPCFDKSKKWYPCKTSRFHYSDIRQIFETKSQLRGSYLSGSIELISLLTNKDNSHIDDLNSYLDFIKNQDSIVYKRIRKQINNIQDERVKNIIEQSFEECTSNLKIEFDNYEYSWSITPDFIQKIKNTVIIANRFKKLLDNGLCLMDHYLMARCFRTFNKTKKEYSRPSYNNIIYTGDAHTNNYIRILKQIGFNIDYQQVNIDVAKMKNTIDVINRKYIKENFQCLIFDKDFKQPMFHQRYKINNNK